MRKYYTKIRGGEVHPIGYQTLSNWGGLVIYDCDSDTCISGFDFGDGVHHLRKTKIHYTTTGRPYIVRYQTRYYFDEILRIN